MTKLRHITTILFILLSAMTADALSADFTTEGKTFWLSFMGLTDGYLKGAGGNIEPFVLVASKNNCTGTITNPMTGWNQSFNVQAGKVIRIDVPQEEGYCDANGIAESIGNPKGANVAILGATLAKAPVTSVDSMMEAIRIELGEKKARFLEGNKKALIAGMESAR